MAGPTVTLDLLVEALRPTLEAAGFEDAGHGVSGTFHWARFRRQETRYGKRMVRLVTLSHAPEDHAYVAYSDLVARRTYTTTPAGKETRRYGSAEGAGAAVGELAAAVRGWVGA
ncbi:MAG TPA: hypothetical protein VII06_00840 [Chloroflexota bacterium]|jgi:hypothetical protein